MDYQHGIQDLGLGRLKENWTFWIVPDYLICLSLQHLTSRRIKRECHKRDLHVADCFLVWWESFLLMFSTKSSLACEASRRGGILSLGKSRPYNDRIQNEIFLCIFMASSLGENLENSTFSWKGFILQLLCLWLVKGFLWWGQKLTNLGFPVWSQDHTKIFFISILTV